ncbi:MAG TPA: hypothetical protein VMG99_01465 [Thermoplasmata archaeon]|nr:hypothetical protein [Thermoplasmata archaeon]
MSGSLGSAGTSALVFLAIIVLIMVRRTYMLSRGSVYSPGRVFSYGGFSMLLFAVFAATTIYVAVGTWGTVGYALLAPYVAIVVGSVFVAEPRVRRLVKFEERADGRTYYLLPLIVPVLTLVLFIVRVAVEIWLFGLDSIATFAIPTSLSSGALEILIAFDLLYGISIGLLIGRGLAIRAAFNARQPAPESAQPLRSG